ncbi:cytochrome-c peroxidase [Aurantiacibacter xanthus]|uniref:Methylamine utilization protein MauG n=1 Tax=Aurantiacibacter xanthus TaxID=1784712 RepID=A0A3A1P3R0_9SPHN|nr:cytochrome c peroxidase [Aurantiacibacter xanthus]RIV86108.1 cytochrome-c peroxidase [Aurantiacibacter xanthus]
MAITARTILLAAAAVFLGAAGAGDEEASNVGWLRAAYAGPPASWPAPELEEGAEFTEFGPLDRPARPEGIAAEQIALGERLFKDPRLSASGQIACESCHNRQLGWGDGLPVSFGHDRQTGTRNAQSLFTAAYMNELFWDGRAGSLEEQAHMPIVNPVEMAAEADMIVARLNTIEDYRDAFAKAYGRDEITMDDVAAALTAFQRAIVLPTSRFDQVFSRGTEVLSDEQLRGLHLFRTKAGCANCHSGPLLSDQRYHNLQISFYGRRLEDLGRYAITGDPQDVGRFRTPSLRGLSRTGPYMHNGVFPSLRGIVNLYARGGGRDRRVQSATTTAPPPQPDPLLKARELSREEREALVAFLETL